MLMARLITLIVNGKLIEMDNFVQGFIERIVSGILSALEGVSDVKYVNVSIEGDDTEIEVNDTRLLINPFVCKIIRNTIMGMVRSLKGVNEIVTMNISISK
jgi:hypothetical protein